jgi:hypothetical protein
MKENLAIIHRAHPVDLPHPHLHRAHPVAHPVAHRLVAQLAVQIKIVDVKIFRLVVAPVIDEALREMFHKVAKPVIHVGFGLHQWKEINLESVPEFLNQIFQKK